MHPWIRLSRRELVAERSEGSDDDVHFPERLVRRVVLAFSAVGDRVLDPFAGFGTTAVVAMRLRRRAIAIELLPERADLIRRRVGDAAQVITGDARDLATLVHEPIDLCFTSPPYMTRVGHAENPLTGYQTPDGNYETYLNEIETVGAAVAALLRPNGHLVVNAATTLGPGGPTPLADDIADRLERHLTRCADLPISWDTPPDGIVDDRCLVFRR
jgi:DNA modification methylase